MFQSKQQGFFQQQSINRSIFGQRMFARVSLNRFKRPARQQLKECFDQKSFYFYFIDFIHQQNQLKSRARVSIATAIGRHQDFPDLKEHLKEIGKIIECSITKIF